MARLDVRRRAATAGAGRENLCDRARFTGYDLDGGYAELAVADERYCFPLPDGYADVEAAPLLCAGLIGYRSLRLAGDAERLGLYGFGASAHIVAQVARHQGRRAVRVRRGRATTAARQFARELGAEWAGAVGPGGRRRSSTPRSSSRPSERSSRRRCGRSRKGGTVVCAGIHMSDIPSFPYELLWEERVVRSVANLTRRDGEEFLALAPRVPVRTEVEPLPLAAANDALARLRAGEIRGSAVLVV